MGRRKQVLLPVTTCSKCEPHWSWSLVHIQADSPPSQDPSIALWSKEGDWALGTFLLWLRPALPFLQWSSALAYTVSCVFADSRLNTNAALFLSPPPLATPHKRAFLSPRANSAGYTTALTRPRVKSLASLRVNMQRTFARWGIMGKEKHTLF